MYVYMYTIYIVLTRVRGNLQKFPQTLKPSGPNPTSQPPIPTRVSLSLSPGMTARKPSPEVLPLAVGVRPVARAPWRSPADSPR